MNFGIEMITSQAGLHDPWHQAYKTPCMLVNKQLC